MGRADLFTQQRSNRRRARWITLGFVLFFAWLGFGGDYILHRLGREGVTGSYVHVFPVLGTLLTAIAAGLALRSWRSGADTVLRAVRAREVLAPADEREQILSNVLDEMGVAAGLPRPRLFVVEDPDPNAFTVGLGPESACVVVTTELLVRLRRDELQAVVAHELGHVRNLDVRLHTVLAGMLGAIAFVADGWRRPSKEGQRRSGGGDWESEGDWKGVGLVTAILAVVWLLSWLLAPLVVRVLASCVSRQREFLADAMAAQFTRQPLALAKAVRKIDDPRPTAALVGRGVAHMCVVDPLGRGRSSGSSAAIAAESASHPPLEERVARLEAMGYGEIGSGETRRTPVEVGSGLGARSRPG